MNKQRKKSNTKESPKTTPLTAKQVREICGEKILKWHHEHIVKIKA
jgi:hypothetical protein